MQLATSRSVLDMDLEHEIEDLEKAFECQAGTEKCSVLHNRFRRVVSKFSEHEGDGCRSRWYLVYRFAKLAYECREYDVAQKYFHSALEAIPDNESRYVRSALEKLGYISLEKKAFGEAIVHFKRCLEVQVPGDEPDSAIWNGLAYAFFGRNRFAEAIECAEKAMEKSGDAEASENSCFLLAFCNGARMDRKKERRYTNRLLKLGPGNPNIEYLV